jgi:hypothetical protein
MTIVAEIVEDNGPERPRRVWTPPVVKQLAAGMAENNVTGAFDGLAPS